MHLLGCWPLFSWTSFVVRFYLHGLVWLFAFIFMSLFGCSPLPTWPCFLIAVKQIDVLGRSPLYTWSYSPLYALASLVFRLNQQWRPWAFSFTCIDLFHSVGPEVYGICACTFF